MSIINSFPNGGEDIDTTKIYTTDDTAETALADADYIPFYDTSAGGKRKTLWSNIKAVLKTYFDTLYQKVLTAGNNITISGTTINATEVRNNYSLNEQVVGTWIDGKKLYQKTVACGNPTNEGSSKTVAHNISNIEKVISCFGYSATAATNGTTITLPRAYSTDWIDVQANSTSIIFYFGKYNQALVESYITLIYTKTTD